MALQNLPVTFCLDRAGLCGPDGPTHHGVFDNTYLRTFPNMVVMAPGDAQDVEPMLEFALAYDGPASLRYPKTTAEHLERPLCPVELGRADVLEWGEDGVCVAVGALLDDCVRAAERLRAEGLDVGVINARFAKPLDRDTILRAVEETGFVITVEESTLCGGFGSAVLEAACQSGVPTGNIRCLGIPDRFIEHGERNELLHDIGLDEDGLVAAAHAMVERRGLVEE